MLNENVPDFDYFFSDGSEYNCRASTNGAKICKGFESTGKYKGAKTCTKGTKGGAKGTSNCCGTDK